MERRTLLKAIMSLPLIRLLPAAQSKAKLKFGTKTVITFDKWPEDMYVQLQTRKSSWSGWTERRVRYIDRKGRRSEWSDWAKT